VPEERPDRSGFAIAALMLSCACSTHNAVPAAPTPGAGSSRNEQVVEVLVKRDDKKLTAMLANGARAAEFARTIEDAWSATGASAGAYRGVRETWSFADDGDGAGDVEVSLLQFERGVTELRVRWTQAGRVASLVLQPGDVQARALSVARDVLKGNASDVYGHFSESMKAALSESQFDQTLVSARKQLGGEASIHDIDVEGGRFDVATVQCRGETGGFDLRLTFRKNTDGLEGLFFLPPHAAARADDAPPAYADPSRYEERAITVAGLPGTLTLPRSAAPGPAVVLVHGSGPQDRDETVIANKPFRDLALGLATRGIAVLRYEKRTFGQNAASLRDPANITFDEETVDDAIAAVRLLLRTGGVNPARVFVVGHSQGAMAAPRIAEREPRVFGLVLLAAPARPIEDLLRDQNRYLASIDTSNQAAAKAALARLEAQIERVKSADLASATPAELPLGIPASWWLSLRDYSPLEVAKRLRKPTLLLQGDRDFQVTAPDFEAWKAGLAGEPWASVRMLSGLNHLFETGSGEPSPAEYAKPSHVSEGAVAQIAEWISSLQPKAAGR
jgi:pimeloyl-ACP methyl ester carboxylesterase